MAKQKAGKIVPLLLAGKTPATVIAEGFPKSTVWRWAKILKANPHAGDKYLQTPKPTIQGENKGNGNDFDLPSPLRLRLTIDLELQCPTKTLLR